MAKKIIKAHSYLAAKAGEVPREWLVTLLLASAVLGLIFYIAALNLAVWEGFGKSRLDKNLKVLRQELQTREEFFISELNLFYDKNTNIFIASEKSSAQFVSRPTGVARAGGFAQ